MEKPALFDFGPLFVAVQRQGIFADSKTFVDSIPRRAPEEIVADYLRAQVTPGLEFDLARFVRDNFDVPRAMHVDVAFDENVEEHIRTRWRELRREPDRVEAGSSLLPLPHPYIVPGGRFREIYYWDSYFTMLGLRESGEIALIANMADNFAALIVRYGFVPNGNRTYYLSRSQPPCFALIIELLAELQGPSVYLRYLPALAAEYAYWMDETAPTAHVVKMPDGSVLNRYYDQLDTPRPEAFVEDEVHAAASAQPRGTLWRNIRSAAESGWDFSSRWFGDGATMATICTTDFVPVDLNCLLHQIERTFARSHEVNGDGVQAAAFAEKANRRQEAIRKYFWSERAAFFCDFDLRTGQPAESLTLAAVAPLFFKVATTQQAQAVMLMLKEKFLKPGGLITTLRATGQQWDAPNGWAPLHWWAVGGLENYGHHELAAEIARRWIKLNCDVYARTGRFMEKYNVEDVSLKAGGGEYPAQDGFGWTNGVLLKLLHDYPSAAAV